MLELSGEIILRYWKHSLSNQLASQPRTQENQWKSTRACLWRFEPQWNSNTTTTTQQYVVCRTWKIPQSCFSSCTDCSKTHEPRQARKVSLSSIDRSFNKIVCIDHHHLGNVRIYHIKDVTTRYSAGAVVKGTEMEAAVGILDSHWVRPLWTPDSIQFDQNFANQELNDFLSLHGINPSPIPARRHNKNVFEWKVKVIRDIFLHTKSSNTDFSEIMAAE